MSDVAIIVAKHAGREAVGPVWADESGKSSAFAPLRSLLLVFL